MSGPDDRGPVGVSEIIDILERVGCQFWACEGPSRPVEDMVTCVRCSALRQLYRGDPVEDDRPRDWKQARKMGTRFCVKGLCEMDCRGSCIDVRCSCNN